MRTCATAASPVRAPFLPGVRAEAGNGRASIALAPLAADSHRFDVVAAARSVQPGKRRRRVSLVSQRLVSRRSGRGSRVRCRRSRRAVPGLVKISNQLGTLTLGVKAAERLLRPASGADGPNGAPALPPTAVDDFKCYTAKVARAPRGQPPFPRLHGRARVDDDFGRVRSRW